LVQKDDKSHFRICTILFCRTGVVLISTHVEERLYC
jgi:hypothetical protein